MVLHTLGGVRLEGSDFTRPKPLLLLAYLVVEGPQVRRRLAELFWVRGADPMKSLSVALTRLRKGAPGVVEADDERAWATVESDVADLLDVHARGAWDDVIARYTGPFLHGFDMRHLGRELEAWIFETREFLAAHVRRALIERAEDRVAAGAYARAKADAERAWTMAEAVSEPEELARIHALLLAGESPHAAAVREAVEPFGIALNATRDEARRQLARRPGASFVHRTGLLPDRATSFVGRTSELDRIANLLRDDDVRLVTVKGPAGVGKSCVAIEAARLIEQEERFAGGVAWIGLEPLTSHRRIPAVLAESLGVKGHRGDAFSAVADAIGDQEVLIVLDGFEHVVAGAGMISELLKRCPALHVLVASRSVLRLEEEHVLELGGLPYPSAPPDSWEGALRYDAVQLFAARARQAKSDIDLDASDLASVIATCRAMDGLPLGIELAASWVQALPIEDIAVRVAEDPSFFEARHRNVPERHRSLRLAFERSWELLGEAERLALKKLSVFRGGIRRDAAAAVADVNIPMLASLTGSSMLRVDRRGRYSRHPMVYRLTRERAAEDAEAFGRARARHGRWWLSFLERREDALTGADAAEPIAEIEEDLENVRAAWRWAAEEGRVDDLRTGCRPLQLFYIQRGGLAAEAAEEFHLAARGLDDHDPACHAVLGRILAAEAWFRFLTNDFDLAEHAAREALRLLEPIADGSRGDETVDDRPALRAIASARNTLGIMATRRGDRDDARREYRSAMAVAKRIGNERQVALFLNNLGLLLKDLGNYAEAERLYEEAIELNRELGNLRSVVRNLANLSSVRIYAGRIREAREAIQEGLALAASLEYERIVPYFLMNDAGAHLAEGNPAEARDRSTEALDLAGEGASAGFRADAKQILGRCAAALGANEPARCAFREALQIVDPDAQRWTLAEILTGLAQLYARVGDPSKAARLLALAGPGADAPRPVGDGVDAMWDRLREALPDDDVQQALRAAENVERSKVVDVALALTVATT